MTPKENIRMTREVVPTNDRTINHLCAVSRMRAAGQSIGSDLMMMMMMFDAFDIVCHKPIRNQNNWRVRVCCSGSVKMKHRRYNAKRKLKMITN